METFSLSATGGNLTSTFFFSDSAPGTGLAGQKVISEGPGGKCNFKGNCIHLSKGAQGRKSAGLSLLNPKLDEDWGWGGGRAGR